MAIARVTLTWNDPQIERIGMDEARRLVIDMTRATYNRANILTPVKTGHLRSKNAFSCCRDFNLIPTASSRARHRSRNAS